MSIINSNSNSSGSIFDDYSISESSSLSALENPANASSGIPAYNNISTSYGSDQAYSMPIDQVKKEINKASDTLSLFLKDLEDILRQINLNPFNNPNLEESHTYIWDEINKNQSLFPAIEIEGYPGDLKYPKPPFICFDQYLYAEDCITRGHRKFVKEYDNLISNSTFGHIYDFREIIKYLINEIENIKNSLSINFGDRYEDESQQQVSTYFLYWAKMAVHYKELFAKAITTPPASISESELDKATKKQAAQFQAFFSIRVNSSTVSIDNQLDSLHKDLVTNCNIFYTRYLNPALRFKTKVISDFSLDFQTTQMKSEMPTLAEEVTIALLSVEGNFKSILTDLLERRNNASQKIDAILQSLILRRKYANYIFQLSSKALTKERITAVKTSDSYAALLSSIYVSNSHVNSLNSSHGLLDDLGDDSHPQYLMKSGGAITGDVLIENEAKIGGVNITKHMHSGIDGSERVRSIDIDYDSVRRDISLNQVISASKEIVITIDSYTPDILQGGVPIADVNISINIPDDIKDKYDFEILYIEI